LRLSAGLLAWQKGLKRYLNLATRQKYNLSDSSANVYNYLSQVEGKKELDDFIES